MEVSLITTRKNQLRVHLADLGHPVVGDKKYGAKTDPIKRLALHASQLVLAQSYHWSSAGLQRPHAANSIACLPWNNPPARRPNQPL